MDTFVRKLRGASSNQNLPVYERIVPKDWIKTTVNNQYVDLSRYIGDWPFNDYEISLDFLIPSDSPYLESGTITLATTRANQSSIRIYSNHINVYIIGTNVFEQEVSLDTPHSIILNTGSRKIILDGTESSFEHDQSSSGIQTFTVINNAVPGSVYFGEMKFKRSAAEAYAFDFIPVVINDVSCYKNILLDNDTVSANTGDLMAFNL